MKKTYIGIVRDHSGSMQSITEAARKDYNAQISEIKGGAIREGQDVIVSVVTFGPAADYSSKVPVTREIVNSSIGSLQPLQSYSATGGTPLYDAVGDLIEQFESLPDAKAPDVAFLLLVLTDGQEEHSTKYNKYTLQRKLNELQASGRWTFTFRVPPGYRNRIERDLGVYSGNVIEWETTARGLQDSQVAFAAATSNYMAARSVGQLQTKSFYETNLSNLSKQSVKKALHDITAQVIQLDVTPSDNKKQIKDFVVRHMGDYKLGGAFYQLAKTEPKVHDGKLMAVRDKRTGKIYSGTDARSVLNLPESGTIKVIPGDHGEFEVYVQSKSVNRNLVGGTKLLYWPNVGNPA